MTPSLAPSPQSEKYGNVAANNTVYLIHVSVWWGVYTCMSNIHKDTYYMYNGYIYMCACGVECTQVMGICS